MAVVRHNPWAGYRNYSALVNNAVRDGRPLSLPALYRPCHWACLGHSVFIQTKRVAQKDFITGGHCCRCHSGDIIMAAMRLLEEQYQLFNHALQVTGDNYLAHSNLCDALNEEGKIQEAIDHCSEAIRMKPDYYIAYNNRGTAYSKLGKYQLTLEDLNKAIALNPDSAEALNNRGSAYIKLGKPQLALEDLNEAIRLNPDYALSYYNRAAVYLNQGQKEPGCRDAQRACTLGDCNILDLARKKGDCR